MTHDVATSPIAVVTTAEPSRADRFVRRLLRVDQSPVPCSAAGASSSAHRAFRLSLVVSGIRCLVTYLAVPILVPLISFASVLAAPLGIALCLVAFVSGTAGVRRFWRSNHRHKWTYTWFMVAVFVTLAVALWFDIARLLT